MGDRHLHILKPHVLFPYSFQEFPTPSIALFPKYDGGKYVKDGKTMILSRGLGTHTIHVRLFNPGEVSVIKVRGKSDVT